MNQHPTDPTEPAEAVLTAAAFGAEPGRWPLPAAGTPRQRWLRAVAAGGQGRYASAAADLAVLARRPADALTSLAASTQASFLRQLGGHIRARGLDGRALAQAGDDLEATADALVGLAADALGLGRFGVSAVLLTRAAAIGDTADVPRLAVRRGWVSAELAMVTGDGAAAVRHAEQAVELTPAGMLRHRVKGQVVLAAALCCAGSADRARAVADAALEEADRCGLVSLRWALACVLGDLGSATRSAEEIGGIRDGCAETISRRGGVWCK